MERGKEIRARGLHDRVLGRRIDTESGLSFPDPLLLICLCIAVLGAITGKLVLTMVGVLALAVVLFARLWARLSLEQLLVTRKFTRQQVFQGDEVNVEVLLENRKPLPLPWLRISFLLPDGLETHQVKPGHRFEGGTSFFETFSLARYERVRAQRKIVAVRRGCYRLGVAHVQSGDLFGFYSSHMETQAISGELVVFPVPHPLPGFAFAAKTPQGDARRTDPTDEDYSRPNGLREYRAGDALHHIDWKATARHNQPFIRTFDPSQGHKILVLLESATSEHTWRFRPEQLEAAVAAAASACALGIHQGHRLGLITNGLPLGTGRPVIAPAAGRVQLERAMQCLARVQPMPTWSLHALLKTHLVPLVGGLHNLTLVYVCSLPRPETMLELARAHRGGATVQAIYVGEGPAPSGDFISVYHSTTSRPGEAAAATRDTVLFA
ncbi:MAG: hypothetical protein ACI8PT_001017 [Gammaproteobacteria bacterium]